MKSHRTLGYALTPVAGAFLCASSFFAGGCVSDASGEGDVVERSAEFRPSWANGDFSGEGSGERFVLARKKGITRLELGIKQAQASAIDQSCWLASQRIRYELQVDARAADVANDAMISAIESGVTRIKPQGRCPDFAPKFVYWELLRKDTAEGGVHQSYDVFVLLSAKKRSYVDAVGAAVDAVKASGVQGSDALAEYVSDGYSEGN